MIIKRSQPVDTAPATAVSKDASELTDKLCGTVSSGANELSVHSGAGLSTTADTSSVGGSSTAGKLEVSKNALAAPGYDMFGYDSGPKQLIVNYLSLVVNEGELRQLFEQFGPVECARVIYDKHSGSSKGYGFVYFCHSLHAANAVKGLTGFELYGKYLRVSYAVPQRPPPAA